MFTYVKLKFGNFYVCQYVLYDTMVAICSINTFSGHFGFLIEITHKSCHNCITVSLN